MTTELYKKHRPKTLDRVVGNRATVQVLTKYLESGKLPHLILFHGPSGCGKTTLARALASHLDCGELDLKEVNCSSSRGVDDVRKIESLMSKQPASGPVRVWILDEVHQLTKDAQHASLKILEDMPKHVYFFLCTTHPQKLLPTIRNRSTQFEVECLREAEIRLLCKRVAKREKIKLSPKTLRAIAKVSEGSSRAALVVLEKIAQLPPKQRTAAVMKQVVENDKEAIDLCRAILKRDWPKVAVLLKSLEDQDAESLRWPILGYARSCLLSGGPVQEQAFMILQAFENNFYDSKHAGLARACYEAILK